MVITLDSNRDLIFIQTRLKELESSNLEHTVHTITNCSIELFEQRADIVSYIIDFNMGEPVDGNASGESKQSTTTTATTTTTTMANGSGQAGAENGNDTMGVDSSTTTTSSSAGGVSSRQARVNNLKLVEIQQIWEWEPYLQACNGQPAPVEAFCQNFDRIPVNEFKVKDKLEVLSPDLCMKEAVHLGTVVQCIGPRIRIRLDGCDKANDFYRMVDANDIHPVGWAQKSRMFYQPPMRFQKDIAGYLDYVERAITRSSDLAGKQCFKTPPIAPKKNLFKAGMKLEVVDRKVPQDIMPATVTMVNAGKLNIHLDGYEENNDFLIEWNSRDLFPVGWCKKAGLLLKPPGPKGIVGCDFSGEKILIIAHTPTLNL